MGGSDAMLGIASGSHIKSQGGIRPSQGGNNDEEIQA
jgi:hypothetical protein